MKILVSYRGIPQSPGWATGDMVVKALRKMGHDVTPYAKNYQQDDWVEGHPEPGQYLWDLILFMECNDGDPQYLELRDVRSRKRACWLFDTSYYPDQCVGLAHKMYFNFIFLANPLSISYYAERGLKNAICLPYACDPDLHYRLIDEKKYECVLVGSIRHDREILAAELSQEEVKLELIGGVFREEYVDALASGRIVVNQNPPQGRGLLNMRWFEAPAAGSVVFGELADHEANDVFRGWRLGYDSPQGLAIKCSDSLGNRSGLTIMAKNLQDHVLCYHTYENRCKTIMETVFPHGV